MTQTVSAAVWKELLAKPLGPTEAVQIALLNNPGLQASYAEVGIAEADLVQASRWRGPTFSFSRLRRGDEVEIERGVFFDVLGLLYHPAFHARERKPSRCHTEPGGGRSAAYRPGHPQGLVPCGRGAGDREVLGAGARGGRD